MELHRKHLIDKFLEHLGHSYEAWCSQHKIPCSDDRLLTFLIDQELIPASNMLRYTILRELNHLNQQNSFQKTQNVGLLANRFNLSERTIWNILKQANTTSIKLRSTAVHKK